MKAKSHALYSCLLKDLRLASSPRIWEALEEGSIDLFPDVTAREISCMSLAHSFLKKYQDFVSDGADSVALGKFLSANNGCRDWRLQLLDLRDEMLVGTFKKVMDEFFTAGSGKPWPRFSDDLSSYFTYDDFVGPGASAGAQGSDFYTKLFSGDLSCTSPWMYKVYIDHLATRPTQSWTDAEFFRRVQNGTAKVVEGNRLTFVDKTTDCSRSICTEPTLNMMFQKGIGDALAKALRRSYGIDLSLQQAKNRDLARNGSLDGSLVTIDLSSASDTISTRMLETFLPSYFVGVLKATRSPYTTVVSTGEKLELWMISTMGNGFTFPLQTILFSGVVLAAAQVDGACELHFPRGQSTGNFGVNGDDIICPREIAGKVVRLLELLGFSVNKAKSFIEGSFRESCGGDFFKGHPVRGVYCKTLKDETSRYAIINALNWWSAREQIPLYNTVSMLKSTVRWLPIPPWEDKSAGIQVPWSMVEGLRRCRRTKSVLYRRLLYSPVKLLISESTISCKSRVRKRYFNPNGLLISFLHGSVEGSSRKASSIGSISIRHDAGRFRANVGVAPNWDYSYSLNPYTDVSRRRFENACWANLTG